MTYIHFFGIDVSQDWFDVAPHEAAKPVQYSNDEDGFAAFLLSISAFDPAACFVVLEATGGYETRLLQFLIAQNICVHRAAPLHVKYFIRSLGRIAKTDKIDAWALARYGAERHQTLSPYVLPDEKQRAFNQLMMRRNDLVAIAAAEKIGQNNLATKMQRHGSSDPCIAF